MSKSSRKSRPQRFKDPGKATATPESATDFDLWLAEAYETEGAFTALVILLRIGGLEVTPIASTFLNFIGAEARWAEVAALFAGSGQAWDGVALFPVFDADGPLENGEARARLRAIEARVREDRLTLNEGEFFDTWGRRLQIEAVTAN